MNESRTSHQRHMGITNVVDAPVDTHLLALAHKTPVVGIDQPIEPRVLDESDIDEIGCEIVVCGLLFRSHSDPLVVVSCVCRHMCICILLQFGSWVTKRIEK